MCSKPSPVRRMRRATPLLLLSLSLLTLLPACTPSGDDGKLVRPDVPAVPQKYRDCFAAITKLPPPGDGYTLIQAATILSDMRVSEIEKQSCGKDLISWATRILNTVRGGKARKP